MLLVGEVVGGVLEGEVSIVTGEVCCADAGVDVGI